MNTLELNIVSSKSLEKQLKIVEERITTLQHEMYELEKVKAACLILMGTPVELPQTELASPASKESPPKSAKKRADKKSGDPVAESTSPLDSSVNLETETNEVSPVQTV